MWSRVRILWVAFIAVVSVTTVQSEGLSVGFDRTAVRFDLSRQQVSYGDLQQIPIGTSESLPVVRVLVALAPDDKTVDLRSEAISPTIIGHISPEFLIDIPTSESADRAVRVLQGLASERLGYRHVEVLGERTIDGARYADLALFPIVVNVHGDIVFAEGIRLAVGSRVFTPSDLIPLESMAVASSESRHTSPASSAGGSDYVIITSQTMAPVLSRLAHYRAACGYASEVVTIESILAAYSGRDEAEQLRSYLKDFHAEGGRYVLFAGDETIVPIRYAYHYNAYSEIQPDMLQLCDLYFADLTGDWDVDNDGIWGERTHDAADLTPELYLGRLPLADSLEFANYIDKIIAYETDAGGADRSWLTRSFFYSSDQMRDYDFSGQHAYIAGAFPGSFEIDTALAVEQSSGVDPAPQNADGAQLPQGMDDGYGITHVIAHGRADGFVVRSAGYNEWPKAYMLTAEQNGAHGCFDSTFTPGRPGFWYSLACDNGGFDQDQPPFSSGRTTAQHLIGAADGAVGLVAYSRWGWVSSSHLLHRAFFDSLFAYPNRPAVQAMYASKEAFPYYRDLVLGQNFFGDPALRLYTATPKDLVVSTERSSNEAAVVVRDGSLPVVGARVTVVESGGVIVESRFTDADGRAQFDGLSITAVYSVGIVKPGYTVSMIELTPSIVTDVDDDNSLLVPSSFHLAQNYPNPFNPSTTIGFSLPHRARVMLRMYNILGQEVARPVDRDFPAGTHTIEWRPDSDLASGVYMYRLEAGEFSAVRKMILLR